MGVKFSRNQNDDVNLGCTMHICSTSIVKKKNSMFKKGSLLIESPGLGQKSFIHFFLYVGKSD